MEFDKKPKVEEVEHADSEASKKVKKKKASKEKKTGTTTTKRIKAPVPAEILAGEDKKANEEKPKAKKSKKKTKKATSPGTATASETKKAKPEADIVDHAEKEDSPKATSRKEARVLEITKETVDSKDEHGNGETLEEGGRDILPDESFEKTILPHDVKEEEGELFISERLRRLIGKDKGESDTPTEGVGTEVADEENTVQSTTATMSSTASGSGQASSRRTTAIPTPPGIGPMRTVGSGGGGSGAIPPSRQPNFSAPLSPNTVPVTANQMPSAANTTPYRNRTAERRNLVAGIIVGGVIEHIRHKRREKRLKTAHKKEVEKLTKTQQFQEAEQFKEKQKTERSKTILEQQLDRLKQSIAPAKKEEKPVATATSTETKTKPPKTEAIPAASMSFYEDFKRKYRSNEAISTTVAAAESKPPIKTTEKPAPVPRQQTENIDEPIQVSPDRRVETSAWHRIEVDKKTGKAVENPELSYGEEFQNEQHQEQLRKQIDEVSVNSEEVRQNYMPMVDKTNSTTVQTHDPIPNASSSRKQKIEKISAPTSLSDTLQDLRDRAGDSTVVDYALVGILILIIIAIIALLV